MLCQLLLLAMLSVSASALSVPEFKTIPVPSIPDALNVIPPNNCNCWHQFGKEFYDPVTGAYAYVAVNERYQRIIIAFRGTVNFEGLVQDIRIFQTPVGWLDNKNVKVHIGFLSCYNALRNDVAQEVQKFIQAYPQYTLTFLGHSLGGAVATLAALDARYTMPQMEQQLVTFGAPRVGNPEFAKLANQQLYRPANDRTGGFLPTSIRVVHYKDLVPHLPFSWMGYQQHGPEVWIPMYDVMDAFYVILTKAKKVVYVLMLVCRILTFIFIATSLV
ncbi:Alpha/Beta hydrolase protein [Syncephalis fuscata]|nr:Alpha/Beta hydrolase protein [Syncephalis fuscata]